MSDTMPPTSRSGAPTSAAPSSVPPSRSLPLLFRVFNAITGTREQPATHRMPSDRRHVLLHLANRADNDTGIARGSNDGLTNDTGLGASTVRRSLVDLIDHGWISRAGSHGPPGREVPLFKVHDAGTKPWPEASARDRDPPSPRTGVSAAAGGVSQEPHPCQPGTPPLSAVPPRGVSGGGLPPSDPPLLPPIVPTQIAQSRGVDRGGGQEQLLLGPPATSSPPAPPPPPPPAARSQSPKAPKPRAADGYAQAWVDGHAAGGATVTRPTASGIACLGRAAAAHARYRDGERIAGDELVRWIRVKARRFREEVEDPTRQRGGMTPFGFVSWLDDDPGERAKPWRRPEERAAEAAAAKLPPKPPEPRPVYSLEHQELAIKFQRRLQGKPDLTPEELTAAARIALQARGSEASAEAAHG